jgi:hypothetical protein
VPTLIIVLSSKHIIAFCFYIGGGYGWFFWKELGY